MGTGSLGAAAAISACATTSNSNQPAPSTRTTAAEPAPEKQPNQRPPATTAVETAIAATMLCRDAYPGATEAAAIVADIEAGR